MTKSLMTTALAAVVALGTVAAAPAAHAEGIYLGFGDSGARFGVVIGPDGHRHHRRNWREVRACTPQRAVDKAYRMGFHRVDVERVGRNRITLSGRRWGERTKLVFSRAPSCPVIRY